MAGTISGGKRAAATNKKKYDAAYIKRYGMSYYAYIGAMGGKKGHFGGFNNPKIARTAGRKGGLISKRGPKE